jgi:hypothetical protein
MTIILEQPKPFQQFLLFKHAKQLRKGDTVIFQETITVDEEGINLETPKTHEESVTITHVHDGPAIYAGYQLVAWENNKGVYAVVANPDPANVDNMGFNG